MKDISYDFLTSKVIRVLFIIMYAFSILSLSIWVVPNSSFDLIRLIFIDAVTLLVGITNIILILKSKKNGYLLDKKQGFIFLGLNIVSYIVSILAYVQEKFLLVISSKVLFSVLSNIITTLMFIALFLVVLFKERVSVSFVKPFKIIFVIAICLGVILEIIFYVLTYIPFNFVNCLSIAVSLILSITSTVLFEIILPIKLLKWLDDSITKNSIE